MAVFRIEKTRDYTVMSNHHLRDRSLSLKAKGLLSLMLSLPEEWDYTTKGLARICKDGVDRICAGVRELEEHGYVIRQRVRNPNGQLGAIEYTILEQPRPPEPKPEKPERENPVWDNCTMFPLCFSTCRRHSFSAHRKSAGGFSGDPRKNLPCLITVNQPRFSFSSVSIWASVFLSRL